MCVMAGYCAKASSKATPTKEQTKLINLVTNFALESEGGDYKKYLRILKSYDQMQLKNDLIGLRRSYGYRTELGYRCTYLMTYLSMDYLSNLRLLMEPYYEQRESWKVHDATGKFPESKYKNYVDWMSLPEFLSMIYYHNNDKRVARLLLSIWGDGGFSELLDPIQVGLIEGETEFALGVMVENDTIARHLAWDYASSYLVDEISKHKYYKKLRDIEKMAQRLSPKLKKAAKQFVFYAKQSFNHKIPW